MYTSPTLSELAKAMSMFQGKIQNVVKDAANPFFNSKYADLASILDVIRKPLAECGLSVIGTIEPNTHGTPGNVVTVSMTVLHLSGEFISSSLTLHAKDGGPQSIGSAITYARRYLIQTMCNLASEDDDGNAATHGNAPVKVAAPIKPVETVKKNVADPKALTNAALNASKRATEAIKAPVKAVNTPEPLETDDPNDPFFRG